jgi:hypothetical protein
VFRHVLSSVRPSHLCSSIRRSVSVYCSVLGHRSSDEVRGMSQRQDYNGELHLCSSLCIIGVMH